MLTKMIKIVILLVIVSAIVGAIVFVLYHDGIILRGAVSVSKFRDKRKTVGSTFLVRAKVAEVWGPYEGRYVIVGDKDTGKWGAILGYIPPGESVPERGDVILTKIVVGEELLQGPNFATNTRIESWEKCWIPVKIPPLF